MADYKNIISDILYAEGGLSKDPNDKSASKNPVPDGSGNHTNKGITWTTFVNLGKQLGYNPTIQLFYQMPNDIWLKIYKLGFWDYIKAGNLNSQAIANLYVQMAWGSGRDTAINQMFNWLNRYKQGFVKFKTKDNIIKAINSISNSNEELKLFLFLWDQRMLYLQSLTNLWKVYKNGWTKRMNKIKENGILLIQNSDLKKKYLIPLILSIPIIWFLVIRKKS